jgi:hypothetical protein
MSKQTAEPISAASAEEQGSTGVIDTPQVDRKTLTRERDAAKELQKDRLAGLNNETLIDLYRQMILIRRFEEKSAEVYSAGRLAASAICTSVRKPFQLAPLGDKKDDYAYQLSRTWSRTGKRNVS